MRYSFNWPAFIVEYPWDPINAKHYHAAKAWCEQNLTNRDWNIKERVDQHGNFHATFWFQNKETLVLFKLAML